MKNTGRCPKCGGDNIRTPESRRGDRSTVGVTSFKLLSVDLYLCMDCGYVEEYGHLDQKIIEVIESNWKKHKL